MVQLSVLFLLTFLKDFSLKPFTQGLSHAISHHLQALATLYTEGADDGSQYRDGKINHFLDSLSLHLLSLSFFDVTIPGYNAEFTKPWLQYDVLVVAVRSAAAASGA